MISKEQLLYIMPTAGPRADVFLDPLNLSMEACQISEAAVREAMFLANVSHESSELRFMEEQWGPKQVPVQATYRTRMGNNKPEAILIASRHGDSDPGHYFRGVGPVQVTGFDNLCIAADFYGIDRENMMDWFRTPEGGCKASAHFWMANGLNAIADKENYDSLADEFDEACDRINFGHRTNRLGDSNGWNDRLAHYQRAKVALGLA